MDNSNRKFSLANSSKFQSVTWRSINPLNKITPLSIASYKTLPETQSSLLKNTSSSMSSKSGLMTRPIFQSTVARRVHIVPYQKELEPNIYPAYAASLSKRFYLPETLKMQVVEEKVKQLETFNRRTLQEYNEMLEDQLKQQFNDYQYMQEQELARLSDERYYSRQQEVKEEIMRARHKLHQHDYENSSFSSNEDSFEEEKKKRRKRRQLRAERDTKRQALPLIETKLKEVKPEEDKDREEDNAHMLQMSTELKSLQDDMQSKLKAMETERYLAHFNNNYYLYGQPDYSRVFAAVNKYDDWEREIYDEMEKKHKEKAVANIKHEVLPNEIKEEDDEQKESPREIKEEVPPQPQVSTLKYPRRKKKALSDGPKIGPIVINQRKK